jgi:hypothetical protein
MIRRIDEKKSYQIVQDLRLPARRVKGRIAGLCNPLRKTAGGRKDKQAGNFFGNRSDSSLSGTPMGFAALYPSYPKQRIVG